MNDNGWSNIPLEQILQLVVGLFGTGFLGKVYESRKNERSKNTDSAWTQLKDINEITGKQISSLQEHNNKIETEYREVYKQNLDLQKLIGELEELYDDESEKNKELLKHIEALTKQAQLKNGADNNDELK